jgi:Uma2 family endonuclease
MGMDRDLRTSGLEYDSGKDTARMQTEVTKKLFTVDEYYQMAAAGIIGPEERVELINGEVIQMSPIGDQHAGCVNTANKLLVRALGDDVVVSVQNPLQLDNYTEPEPDVVVLKPRPDNYRGKKARAEDVLWVIEVSDNTLRYDRTVKVDKYAAAAVPEVWVENLATDELLVFREPLGSTYAVCLTLKRSDSISPLAFPNCTFNVQDLIG